MDLISDKAFETNVLKAIFFKKTCTQKRHVSVHAFYNLTILKF